MIALIAGTRPEIIKLAPVYEALARRRMHPFWLYTGQQPDLAKETFAVFDMEPEWSHKMLREDGSLAELHTQLSAFMQGAFKGLEPELVVVQGDTLSAAVGAQVAFLQGIKTAHVEAGLRSYDTQSPFPEEACRVWIDAVADYKFAPTPQATRDLRGDVWVTGNTGMDALNMIKPKKARKGKYAVVTMHRRENAAGVENVVSAVKNLAANRVFDYIVWPVHPNPMVRDVVPDLMKGTPNVQCVKPLAYDKMVNLVRGACLLLTDSGGLQEDALGLDVPCLVMRKETERPEGVRAGGARLVGTDRSKIIGWAKWLMMDHASWLSMAAAQNPYGDGKAADRIAYTLKHQLTGGKVPDPKKATWTPPTLVP